MPTVDTRRSALISYVACLIAIAGLMAIVALGGTTITARQTAADLSTPHFKEMK